MSKVEKVNFEDALNMTGFGKFNFLAFMLCSGIIMGMVFELFSVAFLVPASACELLTTSSQQGVMAAMPLSGVITTSFLWGYLADTRGRKKVLTFSMSMAFVAGAVTAFSPHWIFFAAVKFLSSSAVAGAFALSLTLLSETTPEAKRSMLLVLTTSVFFCCNAFMAVISIPVLPLDFSYYIPTLGIHFNSWRLLNLIFCLPCAISAIGLAFAYESPKYLLSVGREEEALKVMRSIFVINNGKSGEEYKVKSMTLNEDNAAQNVTGFWSSLIAQTLPLFKLPLLKNTLLISAIFLCVYMSFNPFMVWLPFIADGLMKSVERGDEGLTFCQRLQATHNNTEVQMENDCSLNTTAMTMVFSIGMLLAVINTLITILLNYVGRKKLLLVIQTLAGVAALLVNVSTSWVVGAVMFIVFLAGVLNFGFLNTFAVDVFPTYVKAMAVCLTLMVGRGSAVIGINLIKEMLDSHCESSFYIFGGLTIFGAFLAFFLPGDKKPKQRKCPET